MVNVIRCVGLRPQTHNHGCFNAAPRIKCDARTSLPGDAADGAQRPKPKGRARSAVSHSHIIHVEGRKHALQKEFDIGRRQARFHEALLLLQTAASSHPEPHVPPATSPIAAPRSCPPTGPQTHSLSRSQHGLRPAPWRSKRPSSTCLLPYLSLHRTSWPSFQHTTHSQ